jgi:hypothetical protein
MSAAGKKLRRLAAPMMTRPTTCRRRLPLCQQSSPTGRAATWPSGSGRKRRRSQGVALSGAPCAARKVTSPRAVPCSLHPWRRRVAATGRCRRRWRTLTRQYYLSNPTKAQPPQQHGRWQHMLVLRKLARCGGSSHLSHLVRKQRTKSHHPQPSCSRYYTLVIMIINMEVW